MSIGSGVHPNGHSRIGCRRRSWPGDERNVVHVKYGLRRSGAVLKPEAVDTALPRRDECGNGNVDLLPGVGRERSERLAGSNGAAARHGLHLQLLSAAGAAMNPERQIREARRIERGVLKIERLPCARRHADGLCAGMNRIGVAQTHARPTPVLPAVLEGVVVNRLDGLRAALCRAQ